jgi:hypothetical protein
MKKIIVLGFLALAVKTKAQIAPDKVEHFAVGMALGGSFQYMMRNSDLTANQRTVISTTLVSIIGMCKEVYDGSTTRGTASNADWIATGLGGFAGSMTVRYTIKYSEQRKRTMPVL